MAGPDDMTIRWLLKFAVDFMLFASEFFDSEFKEPANWRMADSQHEDGNESSSIPKDHSP